MALAPKDIAAGLALFCLIPVLNLIDAAIKGYVFHAAGLSS